MSADNVSASWDRGCRVPYVFSTRSNFIQTKAYYTLLKVIHRDVVGKRCCFLVPNWAMWAEKNWIGEKQETKSNKEVCSSTRGLQSTWVHIKQTTLHWRFLVKKTVRFHLDLPTSRAQIFSRARSAGGRFFVRVSAAKASERAKAGANYRNRKWEAKDFEEV